MLIYVVDSNDSARLDEARAELQSMLKDDELRDVVVLVYANKQDLPKATPLSTVADKLELSSLRGRKWHVQATCALTGSGLVEGLDWASTQMKSRKKV